MVVVSGTGTLTVFSNHTANRAEGCDQLGLLIAVLACVVLYCSGHCHHGRSFKHRLPVILYYSSEIIDIDFFLEGVFTNVH